jgi:hypothetical protein
VSVTHAVIPYGMGDTGVTEKRTKIVNYYGDDRSHPPITSYNDGQVQTTTSPT